MTDPVFQGFNRHFVLTFKNDTQRTTHTGYFNPEVEINHYNVIIDYRNFFHEPVKNDVRIHENIKKIAKGQGSDCKTGCLLDHLYFEK